MKYFLRRFGVVLAGVLFLGGCNLLHLPLILFGPEPKIPAKVKKLATEEEETKVYVAILTYGSEKLGDYRSDREISAYFRKDLREWVKYNEENVEVVPISEVQSYQNENPEWKSLTLAEIGKDLDVDYLIGVEVKELQIGKRGGVYNGRAELRVRLANVNDEGETVIPHEVSHEFPREGHAITEFDLTESMFRQKFFESLSVKLAWLFTAHPTNKEYGMK